MRSIWKFPLKVTDRQPISIPVGAVSLSVQIQNDIPCLWALVDTEADTEQREVSIFGTGHMVSEEGQYISTFQMHNGGLVFHAFIK